MERRLPVGAEVQNGRGVHFRVWAPKSSSVAVELLSETGRTQHFPLIAEQDGYFAGLVEGIQAGARYKFRLESGAFPDPVSRFQPEGPHGPSEIIDPTRFRWTDQDWKGLPVKQLVIYEMHIGTFTPEGTWRAAMEQLPELKRFGITMVEVMPIAEFAGRFGWGYDGVDLFAPTQLYGSAEDLRAFVNRAHELEMMVILDVVYNHLGPDGNYLPEYSKDYFSSKYSCEWGDAINFDGENSAPVREFFLANARYWIDEFHMDGLRLDATQQIFDQSEKHILAEITSTVREAGRGRTIYIVGENEPQNARMLRPLESGGHGLDALWNDDYHHTAMVAATGRSEAYYSDYKGSPQEFISACKYGYLFQGQWYRWQKQRRGTPALDLSPANFVFFLQNHDQIANSLRGQRIHQITDPGLFRALTALTLLGPPTPMLFQGQEFAASTPFFYFADHHPELTKSVRQGRAKFLSQFRSIASRECQSFLIEPGQGETFERCKLNFQERQTHGLTYTLHEDLLRLRREDATLSEAEFLDGAVLSEQAFVLRFFSALGDDRLLLVNLGRDLHLNPAPEPLLAPIENHGWRVLWSSEAPEYGGCGTPPPETKENWLIPGHAALLMEPNENSEVPNARISQAD